MKRWMVDHLIRSKRTWLAGGALLILLGLLAVRLAVESQPALAAAPEIFASPVHAGCYLAKADRCKIHVEPFTINLAVGKKLVLFRLLATRRQTGTQTTIYDFRPDQSNPVPDSGSTFTPSAVAKDFAARCGESYTISLQGQDSGDTSLLNLGVTNPFTCPTGTFNDYLPVIRRN
jgi:hypothetical protein